MAVDYLPQSLVKPLSSGRCVSSEVSAETALAVRSCPHPKVLLVALAALQEPCVQLPSAICLCCGAILPAWGYYLG